MKRTLRLTTMLHYPSETVWRMLTEPALLGSWFMQNDIVPEPGAEFTFRMAPQKGWDGITHCRIMELEPLRKISYTYRGEATGEKTLACAGVHSEKLDQAAKGIFARLDTVLTFELEPTCGGTLLKMQHAGYMGFLQVLISYVMELGWKKQLNKKLPAALQQLAGR